MENQEDGRSPLRGSGHSASGPSPVPGLGDTASVLNAVPEGFLPLSTYPQERIGYDGLVFCGNGHTIFNASHHYAGAEAREVASFIVAACNSYQELRDALNEALRENIALRCINGGGCDANADGPHPTLVGKGRERFCVECGEMVNAKGCSTPWFHGGRLERAKARVLTAQGMRTGTAKTPKAVEGRSPASLVGSADAPNPSPEQSS